MRTQRLAALPSRPAAVALSFTPSAVGTRTGSLAIGLSNGAQSVSLAGIGSSTSATGVLSLSPAPLTFSGYTIGDNPSKSVMVTNKGAAATGIAAITLKGDPSVTRRNTCGASLAAGASCTYHHHLPAGRLRDLCGQLAVTEGSSAVDTVSVTGVSSPDN